jgi:hypothetical protein
MTDLSPQVQEIVDAYENTSDKYKALSAVLRAAANQVIEEVSPVEELLSLAEELEQI